MPAAVVELTPVTVVVVAVEMMIVLLTPSEPVEPGAGRVSEAATTVRIVDRAAVERQGGGRGLVERVGRLSGGDGVGELRVLVPLPLL